MPVLLPYPFVRRTACAVALVAALSGCSSEGLDVDGFSAGACTDMAPTLQEVDEALREVGDEDIEPRAAADRFRAAQEVLKPVLDSDADVAEQVRELVTRLGFFRLSVDSNSYEAKQDDDVRTALDSLAEACRA